MTQRNRPGYPLPSGELGEDEIVCQLVYLPNRDEYWQALLGAISYMSTWKAWERDDDKRGKDAAANWREAFELTIGCWRMTCLEDLTQTVNDILEFMQTRKDCCDDNMTYLPVDPIETDIEPNIGDPPDEYGETAIADWDEWSSHVCYNAHLYVDYLAHAGEQLKDATTTSVIFVGLIAALLSLLAFSGVLLPVDFVLAPGVVSGFLLTGTITTFEDTETDIEAARAAIVCAIMQGGDLPKAVEDALGSGADWTLFYQFIDYVSAISILHEGGYNTDYLPTETRVDCDCETIMKVMFGAEYSGFFVVDINSENRSTNGFEYETLGVAFFELDGTTRKEVEILAISHSPVPVNDGAQGTYFARDADMNTVYDSDIMPGFPLTCATLSITDSRDEPAPPWWIEFDATITWENV